MFRRTTATEKLLGLTKRIRGISGGTSASKTISILMIEIDYAQSQERTGLTSVVSESMPHLKRGAIRDFKNIMMEHGYWQDTHWNASDFTYTFKFKDKDGNMKDGWKIEFFSADMPSKVRGPRRDRLFMNEANNMPYETYLQLELRTKDVIWLDWNPTTEFWFYTEVKHLANVDFMILTYKDNEGLDQSIVDSIESHKDNKNWWRVYGEGQLGEVEGKIYRDWKLDLEEVPHEARLERYGLDFGYSNDPTVIVAIYYWNGAYILDELMYQRGMKNNQIAGFIQNLDPALIMADSAEPKSIDEIKEYGINILPCQKGPGSINRGIDYVQQQRVFVTKRSLNIIREYRNYLWKTDRDGKIINDPDGGFDHTMDAIRYGMESLKSNNEELYVPPVTLLGSMGQSTGGFKL